MEEVFLPVVIFLLVYLAITFEWTQKAVAALLGVAALLVGNVVEAVKIAQMTQGSPLKILILFSMVTGITSAFLDNVTTVLIMVPIVIELTVGMGLDPRLYVISQAVVSNLGGTATLIGSKTGLTFNQFAVHLSRPSSPSVCLP